MVSPADAQVFNIGPALAAFGAGRDMRRQQNEAQYQTGQRNALAQAGDAAAKGNLEGARDTLFRAGNLGDAFAIDQNMQQRQAATNEADAAHQSEIQRGLANLALDPSITDAQWAQAVTQYFQIHGDQEDIAALPGSPLLDPSIRRTLAAGAMEAADYYSRTNPSGGDQFTLSPGQQRFDANGNQIANVPETPEQQAQMIPLQEVKQLGLDPTRAYQRLADGRVQEIGAAGVTVNNTLNTQPNISSAMEGQAIELTNTASELQNQVAELELLRNVTQTTDTGFWQNATLGIRRALAGIGIISDENIQGQQLLEALQNQQALRLRNPDSGFGLTGNTSERDVAFLKATVPNLANTPEANMAIATILLAKQRRAADLAALQADYIWQNGTLEGWNDYQRQYIEETPFFTEEEIKWIEDATGVTWESVNGGQDNAPAPAGTQQGVSGTPVPDANGAASPGSPAVGTTFNGADGFLYTFKDWNGDGVPEWGHD